MSMMGHGGGSRKASIIKEIKALGDLNKLAAEIKHHQSVIDIRIKETETAKKAKAEADKRHVDADRREQALDERDKKQHQRDLEQNKRDAGLIEWHRKLELQQAESERVTQAATKTTQEAARKESEADRRAAEI